MGALYISTSVLQSSIQFCMSGSLTGWAGIGFGPVHQAMDTYVGWITSSGKAVLQNGYSNSFDIPYTDSGNTAQIVSYSQNSNNFRMCFKRGLNTGNPKDTIFKLGDTITAYWAYHFDINPESVSPSIRYAQHTHTGSRQITLPRLPTLSPTRTIVPIPTLSPTIVPSLNPTLVPSLNPVPTPTQSLLVPTNSPSFSITTYLQGDENFYVSWTIHQNNIQFNYDCKVTGWVGIGFDRGSKIHQSSDTYISWILSSGTGVIHDGYSTSETQPQTDIIQSAIVLNASQIGDRFQLSFQRSLRTNDSQDIGLDTLDSLLMGWAYHPFSNPNTLDIERARISTHTKRGSKWVNLYTGETKEKTEPFRPSVYYLSVVLCIFCLFTFTRIRKHLDTQSPDGFYRGSQFEPYIHTRVWLESRIPVLNISKIDMLVAIIILALNIGTIFLGTRLGFSQSQVWGDLCAANSLLVAIPATRNSIITWMVKVPFDQTIMYHRWLGRITAIQAIVHFATSIDQSYFEWNATNNHGFVAIICLAIIIATSIEHFRREMFNFFFYSHHILFVYYTFGSLHSKSFFRYTCIAIGIYGLDRLIRLFRGIYPRKILHAERLTDRVLKVRFPKNRYTHQRIAQYAFLNFPKVHLLEWHPFTLVNSPNEPFHEVYIKSLGDYTQDIVQNISTGDWLRMDGPYGHWSFEHKNYSHILFVCGGIGITPCISFIRHVYSLPEPQEGFDHIRHIYLVWCCFSEKEAQWVNQELLKVIESSQDPKYPNFYLYVFITGQSIVKNPTYFVGRPDIDKIFDTTETRMLDEHSRACVFVCGPKSLSQQVWDTWSRRATHKRYDFRQEIFEF